MEFEDLESMTKTIVSQLRKHEVTTVESLAILTFEQLAEILKGISETKIREIQRETWEKMGYWFTPASQLKQLRKDELTFSTGSKALDKLVGGGIRTRAITEFVGEYGSGKTECLLTLLVETLGNNSEYTALYLDSEESFNEKRLVQISKSRGYDTESLLPRITYVPVWHTDHFMQTVKWSDSVIKNRKVKIIFVDSIIAPLRSEYMGREVLWQRQQLLNKILRDLLNYAKAFNLAVAVTNQVVANPQQAISFDPTANQIPAGGNILAHNAETRIYLRKGQGNIRIARLIDSSWLPPGECIFRITEKGIEDITPKEEEKP